MSQGGGVLFACGGTGGHIQPALAIAEALKGFSPSLRIAFVGRRGGAAERSIERAGFPLFGIPIAGLQRKKVFSNLKLLLLFPLSLILSFLILRRERPRLVVGTGGYVAVPVLAAGWVRRLPLVLQEQNSYPGLSTRLFAGAARRVYLGFGEAARYLSRKTKVQVTGNPLRQAKGEGDPRTRLGIQAGERVLLITGGSQGSLPINRMMASCLQDVLGSVSGGKVAVFWQTGSRDLAYIRGIMGAEPRVRVFDYAENFHDYYLAADLTVCRAGAMTVSELMRYGLPAVFIPLPGAAENHQRKNAKMVEGLGGGLCFEETEGPGKLGLLIAGLLADPIKLKVMRENMKSAATPDAAGRIARELVEGIPA